MRHGPEHQNEPFEVYAFAMKKGMPRHNFRFLRVIGERLLRQQCCVFAAECPCRSKQDELPSRVWWEENQDKTMINQKEPDNNNTATNCRSRKYVGLDALLSLLKQKTNDL
eukprot:scaffold4460_cov67-Cylindrotheca_fusiformis.AAC.2